MNRMYWLLALAACTPPARQDADAPAGGEPRIDTPPPPPALPLEVHALGVQGYVLRRGDDVVMTAPMYTRQSTFEVTVNASLHPDDAAVDAGLATEPLDKLSAIISGHAHYDHFIDVAHILTLAPNATSYVNLTGRHVLAALAPDRAASCTSTQPLVLPRQRVVAMDDPLASHVDYTNCPGQAPPGAPLQGTWLAVPGSHVRLMAFCSMHPAQVGPFHFGQGAIDTDQCDLPAAASGWLEGQTLAFLIDFLDEAGHVAMRVYYQDAPTNPPLGHVPAAILAEAPVDVAILCVGNYDAVANQPGDVVANLQPRFALSGHWEDFFQPLTAPLQPIPLLNLDAYKAKAAAALPGSPDAPLLVDGAPMDTRQLVTIPANRLVIPPAP
jgi:L-ascorbate metabolism protein UlaG (beta-lactamase superfamily)